MKTKEIYELAKIHVISLEATDVITTSGNGSDDSIGTGGDDMAPDGWTPINW